MRANSAHFFLVFSVQKHTFFDEQIAAAAGGGGVAATPTPPL